MLIGVSILNGNFNLLSMDNKLIKKNGIDLNAACNVIEKSLTKQRQPHEDEDTMKRNIYIYTVNTHLKGKCPSKH